MAQSAFIDRVNRLIECGPVLLAKRFDRGQRRRTQYLFTRLPASISVGNNPECAHPRVEWTDTACGKSGVGAIGLASHVWRVSEYEAARRIYEFVRIETGDWYHKGLRPLAEFAAELAA
ncbi:MAG: hypothetical protein ACR65W_07495 [Methylocystis sp.]|uniref:hypothetical protein n=1 Tax=Methylocystis sp. TaxID=1911079 RepID=UPI003DA2E04F